MASPRPGIQAMRHVLMLAVDAASVLHEEPNDLVRQMLGGSADFLKDVMDDDTKSRPWHVGSWAAFNSSVPTLKVLSLFFSLFS